MQNLVAVAGNGLLDRRAFLRGGAALAAAMTGYTLARSAAAAPLADDPWSRAPGTNVPAYGVPSRFEKNVARTLSNPNGEPQTQHGRTPHHLLYGTSTRTCHAATPKQPIVRTSIAMSIQNCFNSQSAALYFHCVVLAPAVSDMYTYQFTTLLRNAPKI